jgi:colicin import membrane protein
LNAEREHRNAERARRNAERDRTRAESDRRRANDDRERADRNRRQAEQNRERAERNRERAEVRRQRAEADRNMLNGLMDELVDAKVVSSRDDIRSIELTGESLIVNDKKQSTDLHKQLKDKYLKGDGNRIHFSQSAGGSRSFNIHRE